MRRIILTLLSVVLLITLCSCKMTSLDTEALLTPPQMTDVNQEILSAIGSVTGGSYTPVYPKNGAYQSAMNSIDLTGDGVNETVFFYMSDTEQQVGFIILEQRENKWVSIGSVKSQAVAVDRVAFADLNGDKKLETVVGWQYQQGEERAIEIFTFGTTEQMTSVYTGMYNDVTVFDDSVVVITKSTSGKTASAALIGKSGNTVSTLGTVSLNNSISSFISVQSEAADDGKVIYIDEQLENLMYTTEVLTIKNISEFTVSAPEISAQTVRTKAFACTDINDDGKLDIPVEKALPEYERAGVTESMCYVDWHTYKNGTLEYIMSAYTSVNEQFFIDLPDEWIGNITIQRYPDIERAVQFYKTETVEVTVLEDGEEVVKTETKLLPMFSVRIFSQQEFSESVQSLGWVSIETANENVYAFKADDSVLPEQFKMNAETIAEIFHLV